MYLKDGVFLLHAVTILFICTEGNALRMLEVRVPDHFVRNQSARLECHFDLEGEALYSIKWYKDGAEFYRYVPRDSPQVQVFTLPGVSVEKENSNASLVTLRSVNLSSSGRYRCEVSGEAPSFQTVSDHGDMIVVALPEDGPRITGGRRKYQIGDTVAVNCTSARSKPAAHLVWYINGEQATSSILKGPIITQEKGGMETAVLGLEFRVRAKHFKRGDMKLKCLATIAKVYWRSNEESVEGDKVQKAPVLESREIVLSNESRADRVHASGSCVHLAPCAILVAACSFMNVITAHLTASSPGVSLRYQGRPYQ